MKSTSQPFVTGQEQKRIADTYVGHFDVMSAEDGRHQQTGNVLFEWGRLNEIFVPEVLTLWLRDDEAILSDGHTCDVPRRFLLVFQRPTR